VLGHLLDAEVTLGFRIRKLAAEPGGTIVAWDQEKWTAGLRHQRGDARTLFAAYAALRAANVEQVTEHLGGRPLAAGGPAREPASRGADERATKGARRRRHRAHRIAATEPVMRRAAHRAGHRADPPRRAGVVLVMTYNSAP